MSQEERVNKKQIKKERKKERKTERQWQHCNDNK